MKNSKIILDFIKEKGVSRKKLADLLDLTTRQLYNIMTDKIPLGLSFERLIQFNAIFADYNYKKRVKE
jgi:hypothetical protein